MALLILHLREGAMDSDALGWDWGLRLWPLDPLTGELEQSFPPDNHTPNPTISKSRQPSKYSSFPLLPMSSMTGPSQVHLSLCSGILQ